MIVESVEIDRRPEDVFAYLDQVERHAEWQPEIVSTSVETEGPVRVGTRVKEMRKIGGREQDSSYEITQHEPPGKTAFHGTNGPVRPVGTVTVEPLGDGQRSRVTLEFDLEGHGFGKLIVPFARRQTRKTIASNQQQLKQRLESGA